MSPKVYSVHYLSFVAFIALQMEFINKVCDVKFLITKSSFFSVMVTLYVMKLFINTIFTIFTIFSCFINISFMNFSIETTKSLDDFILNSNLSFLVFYNSSIFHLLQRSSITFSGRADLLALFYNFRREFKVPIENLQECAYRPLNVSLRTTKRDYISLSNFSSTFQALST